MWVIRQHPNPKSLSDRMDEDIVCAPSDRGNDFKINIKSHDERTEMNGPLVYLLSRQRQRRVAMSGTDKF